MSRSRRQRRVSSARNWGRCLVGGFFFGLAAFLVSLVLVAFGFLAYAKSFLQSERFHRMVEGQLEDALRAEVELSEVRWEGTSAFADRVSARGREDAGFAKFGLAGLRADFDLSIKQFKRRVWKVPEIAISQLDVVFSSGGRLAAARKEVAPAASAGRPEGAGTARNLLAEFIPREMELDKARLNTLNLYWEWPDGKVSATGMQTVIQPASGGGAHAVKVRGGAIQGTSVPRLDIDSLDLRWKTREIFVSEAKLRSEGGALVSLEGDIRLGSGETPGSMSIEAAVSQLDLSRIASERGPARVQGELDIEAHIEGDPADVEQSRQQGRVRLRNGVVQTLPILEMLARFTGSKRFERIALRDGGGARFVREQGRTVFSEIDFQSDGLARLTGELVVEEGGNLAGLLHLGVIPGTLAWIPTAEQKIFTESRDGHLWTEVRVSGTVDNPQHDLTARLASAGVEAAMDAVGRILDGGSRGGQGAGKAQPESGAERLGDAIGLGRELLKGFLR